MLCNLSSHKIGFGILFSVFFSVFFSLFCLGTDSFAVSDRTYTIPLTSVGYTQIFSDCDSTCLSDYHYLIFDNSDPTATVVFQFRFNTLYVNTSGIVPYGHTIYSVSDFNSIYYSLSYWSSNNIVITVTLTESICNCPELEEPEPCPVIPDHPYDDKFDQVTKAIYVCAGVLLVLYFFYCIYRIIIKNSGVK